MCFLFLISKEHTYQNLHTCKNTHTHVAREQTSQKKVVKASKIYLLMVFLIKMCESYNKHVKCFWRKQTYISYLLEKHNTIILLLI